MKKTLIAVSSMLLLMAFISCDKQPVEPDVFADYETVATMDVPDMDLTLTLYAEDTLFVGYNRLYFVFRNQNEEIVRSGLEVTVTPMMYMPTMTHSAPVEQPNGPNADGAYQGAVAFIMATMPDGYWELAVQIRDMDQDRTHALTIPVEARNRTEARMRNMIATDDSSKLFIGLIPPREWKVGMNDLKLCVYRKATMMDFPPVEDLNIEIEPTMPSMGHGSSGNEHPAHQQRGHYLGKVNFNMDGWWQVAVRVRRQNQVIAQTEFNVTFAAQ